MLRGLATKPPSVSSFRPFYKELVAFRTRWSHAFRDVETFGRRRTSSSQRFTQSYRFKVERLVGKFQGVGHLLGGWESLGLNDFSAGLPQHFFGMQKNYPGVGISRNYWKAISQLVYSESTAKMSPEGSKKKYKDLLYKLCFYIFYTHAEISR